MITFFAKSIYINSEFIGLCFSFRRYTQALPGGAIVVSWGRLEDTETVMSLSMTVKVLREAGIRLPESMLVQNYEGLAAAVARVMDIWASKMNWEFDPRYDPIEVIEGVWVGDHEVVVKRLGTM